MRHGARRHIVVASLLSLDDSMLRNIYSEREQQLFAVIR
jgi:hypothetical protein